MSNTERFSAELTAIGGHVFVAPDVAQAREYIEKLMQTTGGLSRAAARPAVACLGLPPMATSEKLEKLSDVVLGITKADYALADTGTLVVFSEAGEGRTLSLLPPVHVAVVEESRILAGLDELMEREPRFPERSSAMIFITGPSRTADIERTLTVGVHGPGELHVVVLCGTIGTS